MKKLKHFLKIEVETFDMVILIRKQRIMFKYLRDSRIGTTTNLLGLWLKQVRNLESNQVLSRELNYFIRNSD